MEKNEVQKKGFFDKAMDFIEKIGNAMPDPVSLLTLSKKSATRCRTRSACLLYWRLWL